MSAAPQPSNLLNLLRRAQIRRYWSHLWFRGCVFESGVLWVPERSHAESLARLYGPQLREAFPGLTMRVGTPNGKPESEKPPSFLNAAGRKAWKGERAKEPRQPKLGESE